MSQKQLQKPPAVKTVPATRVSATGITAFSARTYFFLLTSLLYLSIHFIPELGAYDVFGSQWFIIVLIDILVLVLILISKQQEQGSWKIIFRNPFAILLLLFTAWAGVSVFFSINPTEGWVCYARLIATVIAFFNLMILYRGAGEILKPLAILISLILLIESVYSLHLFFNSSTDTSLSAIILNLRGFTGNKNIFAASLVMKFPFVIYCIYRSRPTGKVFYSILLTLGILTLFLVNARASYVSLILIMLCLVGINIREYFVSRKPGDFISSTGLVVIPLLLALFTSNAILTNAKKLRDETGGYGTVAQRLGSASAFNAEDNQVRIRLWKNAIDYTAKHPIMGSGYGNWKLASIPYQRFYTNDLVVPMHAHNDYAETFAETGIIGGLLYLGLFCCILFFTVRTYRSGAEQPIKDLSLFSFLTFIAYAVDAFFNFPGERPISQVFFVLLTALNISAYEAWQPKKEKTGSRNVAPVKRIYVLTGFIILVPAAYITYLTYRSLVVQSTVAADLNNEPLKLDWKEVVPSFPPIPNLSATTQPIDAIKGRYLSEAGQYAEAIALFDRGSKANPMIAYSEFLKAGMYFKQGRLDSASRNAIYAFYTRSRANTYLQTLIAVMAKTKDTATIQKAFDLYIKHRNEVFAWNLYLTGMLNAKEGKANAALLSMADSAIRLFKNDSTAQSLFRAKRVEIANAMNHTASMQPNVFTGQATAQKLYNDAAIAFGTGQKGKDNLTLAGRLFLSSYETNPVNWVALENAGVSYFNNQDFTKAISVFDREISLNVSTNGKPEFFRGVALVNTGQKDRGCASLRTASKKGYQEADPLIQKVCQ